MEWLLELCLAGLLAATLVHAVRLERALGALRRDRAALADMAETFSAGARQAEASVARLQTASDGAGRLLARQLDTSETLKDDLALLSERGELLADRLEALVRAARPLAAEAPKPTPPPPSGPRPAPEKPRGRPPVERELVKALKPAR